MSFSERKDPEIVRQVTEDYQKAASWLPFTALEIKAVFSPEELKEVEEFIDEMEAVTAENERITKLVNNINKYGKVVFKLLKVGKVIV